MAEHLVTVEIGNGGFGFVNKRVVRTDDIIYGVLKVINVDAENVRQCIDPLNYCRSFSSEDINKSFIIGN